MEKIETPNNCCIRFDQAIADMLILVIINKGYYISEPKENHPWDTALWRIKYCPFCGYRLGDQQ
jgi:hypothetical protein